MRKPDYEVGFGGAGMPSEVRAQGRTWVEWVRGEATRAAMSYGGWDDFNIRIVQIEHGQRPGLCDITVSGWGFKHNADAKGRFPVSVRLREVPR